MKYKKLIFFFCFTIFCIHHAIGQEIKIKFDKPTCQINENIRVVFDIPCQCDSIQELRLNQFGKIAGPSKSFTTTHLNGKTTMNIEISYLFKVMTSGKQKLPQLTINNNGKILKTEDFFITVTNDTLGIEKFKEFKAGYSFHVSLPSYMKKTSGMNDYSAIEYKSIENNIYGLVSYQNKEDLKLAGITYTSIKDFYNPIIKDFLSEVSEKEVSKPSYKKKAAINFIETDVSFFDKEKNKKMYGFVGIAETGIAYYIFLSFVEMNQKDVFKRDFQQILYSLKE